jgi:hypothetical protein
VPRKKKAAEAQLPAEFLTKLRSITAKRAKTVIDHILAHGFITTEELSVQYGYDHAPRAARDVRELGIPLETFKVTAANGKKIAAHRFGDPKQVKAARAGGRTVWPKDFKKALAFASGCKCAVCATSATQSATVIGFPGFGSDVKSLPMVLMDRLFSGLSVCTPPTSPPTIPHPPADDRCRPRSTIRTAAHCS